MQHLLAGIDVGTSGVKTGLFDAAGRLLGLGRSSHAISSPRPGWAECDPGVWWNGVIASLTEACSAAGVAASDVSAVGAGTLFPAIVPLDAAAHALQPAILYCDRRSLEQVNAIEAAIPREEYQATIGNMLVPGTCAVTSIAWLRDERPDVYRAAHVIGFANTFIIARLTGCFCTDPSSASLSGLVNAHDPWQWSEKLCEALRIDRDSLPQIIGSDKVAGTVIRSAAQATGLKEGTAVVCGAGDVPVAAVAIGAASAETAAYVAGSTDCIAVPMSSPTCDRRYVNCAYVPRDAWLGIGTTTSSGSSLAWLAEEIFGKGGKAGLDLLMGLASSSPPGSNGLLYLPYLMGERTPVWDPLARGMFVGLTTETTRSDLARAVLEGTAFALRQALECAEHVTGQTVALVRAVGGGTRSPLWNQVKADVLHKPIDVLHHQEAGALGAALLAGLGVGVYGSFRKAVDVARAASAAETIEPDTRHSELYDRLFNLYAQLYPSTRQICQQLAKGGSGRNRDRNRCES